MKNLLKNLYIFYTIGTTYISIEVLFRGYSHWSMFLLAGMCALLIDNLNNKYSFDMDLLLQCSISTIICSFLEGIFGIVFNVILKLNIWDYSNLSTPVFFHGQVSLLFSLAWFFLSFICIIMCDVINYYIFNLYERPYYRILGKVMFKLPLRKDVKN